MIKKIVICLCLISVSTSFLLTDTAFAKKTKETETKIEENINTTNEQIENNTNENIIQTEDTNNEDIDINNSNKSNDNNKKKNKSLFNMSREPNPYYYDNPPEKQPKFSEDITDVLAPIQETDKERKQRLKREQKELKNKGKNKKKNKLKPVKYREVKLKDKAPKTFEEYIEISRDIKREEYEIPEHEYKQDDKIVDLPDPQVRLVKYNKPAGSRDLDLRDLMKNHTFTSQGVLSPDEKKIAYSKVYSYPGTQQVASEVFYIKTDYRGTAMGKLQETHTIQAEIEPILISSGKNQLYKNEKRTFIILDWSEDGQTLAVKERIGALTKGPWKTSLWVYDFNTGKSTELTALREAVRYYWKKEKGIDLIDYMWDIFPLGWDFNNKDRIIVNAYGYGKSGKGYYFLGTWSIDKNNERSEIISETAGADSQISVNGLVLEFKKK